eukprot:2308798-Amphidinium_carterae.1
MQQLPKQVTASDANAQVKETKSTSDSTKRPDEIFRENHNWPVTSMANVCPAWKLSFVPTTWQEHFVEPPEEDVYDKPGQLNM